MNEVPNRLSNHLLHKQYLHATKLLIEAVTLGKDTLEGVESLKELSQDLEQKKKQLHLQLLQELDHQLYMKPSQHILALRRQESGRENFLNTSLQRGTELRLSARNRQKIEIHVGKSEDILDIEEDLTESHPDENSPHFMAILVKCLALLDKLPFCVSEIQEHMSLALLNIVRKTTQHIMDFSRQNEVDQKLALTELVKILFDQFKQVAQAQANWLKIVEKAASVHKISIKTYNMGFYWTQVQVVVSFFFFE